MIASTAAQPTHGNGLLNRIGYAILEAMEYRVVSLVLLGLVIVLWVSIRWRLKRSPTRDECLKTVEGGLSIAMAILVGTVFCLTDPPAFEMLPHEIRGVVGLFAAIILFLFGYDRVVETFRSQ